MAVMQLQYWPAEVLRQKAEPVTEFGDELKKTLEDMAETMYVESGIGLAAPQVGVSLRMIVIDVPKGEERKPDLKALVNPVIVEKSGEIIWEEGCLSFPGITADVTRAAHLTVEFQDYTGAKYTMQVEGLEAVCVQHELDHLNGVNFVDYLSPLKRKLLLRELKRNLSEMGVAAA